jgi:transposase
MTQKMPTQNNTVPPETVIHRRVIGLDAHPDSFTAAILNGPTPLAAVTEKIFNHIPLGQLPGWAKKNTTAQDIIVLEASGNSFQIVRTLAAVERKALVLESCQMGQLKEAHANNDKISAVRIGKAYLSGTAKEVWVPDRQTQDRRDLFYAHRKAVKRTTQVRNRIRSYLSDQGVRLPKALRLATDPDVAERIRKTREWTPRQWQVVEGLLLELRQAEQLRAHWRSLIAQEVLADQTLLSLVRLCGVRDLVAFALGAVIGDIKRFGNPRSLVKYVGLNPAFDDSGENTWSGGIGGHGHIDLRALMIEAAQALMRTQHTLAQWGRKLMGRKGSLSLAVAAVARKLIVAVWYLMNGRWTTLEEIKLPLSLKVGKIISQIGAENLKTMGKTRRDFRDAAFQTLKIPKANPTGSRKTMFAPKPSLGDAVPQTP